MPYASSANCNFFYKRLFKQASQLCSRPEIPQDVSRVKFKIQNTPKDWMQWLAPAPKKKKIKILLLVNILVCYAARCTVHPQASYC